MTPFFPRVDADGPPFFGPDTADFLQAQKDAGIFDVAPAEAEDDEYRRLQDENARLQEENAKLKADLGRSLAWMRQWESSCLQQMGVCHELRQAINLYLDWGAKTNSDLFLLENEFRAAVGRPLRDYDTGKVEGEPDA